MEHDGSAPFALGKLGGVGGRVRMGGGRLEKACVSKKCTTVVFLSVDVSISHIF